MAFLAIVVIVAVAGVGIGLLLAPRLTAWDERRARSAEQGDDAGAYDGDAVVPGSAAGADGEGGGEDD